LEARWRGSSGNKTLKGDRQYEGNLLEAVGISAPGNAAERASPGEEPDDGNLTVDTIKGFSVGRKP
jgi:hypothetical protein